VTFVQQLKWGISEAAATRDMFGCVPSYRRVSCRNDMQENTVNCNFCFVGCLIGFNKYLNLNTVLGGGYGSHSRNFTFLGKGWKIVCVCVCVCVSFSAGVPCDNVASLQKADSRFQLHWLYVLCGGTRIQENCLQYLKHSWILIGVFKVLWP